MHLNQLVKKAHEAAKKAGWWEKKRKRTALEIHALIHSEVAEATEEVRKGNPGYYGDYRGKPCGELSEMADVVIRVADWCGHKGWDLEQAVKEKMAYNKTRGYRHGGKEA